MALEILDVDQGSDAWMAARCGLPTASNFSKILASGRGGAPSKTRLTYLRTLAGERITGAVAEGYSNAHMERGKALEAEARDLYEFESGESVRRIGIGINHGAGASPDGLVGEDGGLEIKSALPHILIGIIEANVPPPEHTAQIQGCMWVFERAWWDLTIYWPAMPKFAARIPRDDRYIDDVLAPGVQRFNDDLDALVERLTGGRVA